MFIFYKIDYIVNDLKLKTMPDAFQIGIEQNLWLLKAKNMVEWWKSTQISIKLVESWTLRIQTSIKNCIE